jgi:hypothetical protein
MDLLYIAGPILDFIISFLDSHISSDFHLTVDNVVYDIYTHCYARPESFSSVL